MTKQNIPQPSGWHLVNIIGLLLMVVVWLTPFMFAPFTSELFELNKMHFVYAMTAICVLLSGIYLVWARTMIVPRTWMDIPIILFVTGLLITTASSIHPYTSIVGYYTRFHGGLLSYASYILIWVMLIAFVGIHPLRKQRVQTLLTGFVLSSMMVAIYGVMQHFGFDEDLWKQDVVNRVFSSLGQPNWLAALLCMAIPLSWVYVLKIDKLLSWRSLWLVVYAILYLCLLYTRSRSGYLGFLSAGVVFVLMSGLVAWKTLSVKPWLVRIGLVGLIALLLGIGSSTPFTPSVWDRLQAEEVVSQPVINPLVPVGGTDSGEIRKIVWAGAWELGKQNWLVGTGLDTFAYSYYWVRPVEHNMVSEWDFIYNRAHNEYLNWWATTGVVGLGTYMVVLIAAYAVMLRPSWQLVKSKGEVEIRNELLWVAGITAGFTTILVTNFFGFSVVVTGLMMFVLPACAILMVDEQPYRVMQIHKWIAVVMASLLMAISVLWLLYTSSTYYANLHYAAARKEYDRRHYESAFALMEKAQRYNPWEPTLMDYSSRVATNLAIEYYFNDQKELAELTSLYAIDKMHTALDRNPYHSTFWKNQADRMITLSTLNSQYLTDALASLILAHELAPTDPKILYNTALLHARIGDIDTAIETLHKTLELKPNYTDALFASAVYYHRRSLDETGVVISSGDHATGIKYLEEYLQYAPDDVDKQKMLAEWRAEIE